MEKRTSMRERLRDYALMAGASVSAFGALYTGAIVKNSVNYVDQIVDTYQTYGTVNPQKIAASFAEDVDLFFEGVGVTAAGLGLLAGGIYSMRKGKKKVEVKIASQERNSYKTPSFLRVLGGNN